MSQTTLIFWPMIAQAALIFAIYVLMGRRRFSAVRSGAAKSQDYRIPIVEPAATATVARNLINQFELPVLFFVVCLSLHLTAGVNYITVIIAWVFVVSRVAHAYVHVTSNRLMLRHRCFLIGAAAVIVLWVWLAVNLAIR